MQLAPEDDQSLSTNLIALETGNNPIAQSYKASHERLGFFEPTVTPSKS